MATSLCYSHFVFLSVSKHNCSRVRCSVFDLQLGHQRPAVFFAIEKNLLPSRDKHMHTFCLNIKPHSYIQ